MDSWLANSETWWALADAGRWLRPNETVRPVHIWAMGSTSTPHGLLKFSPGLINRLLDHRSMIIQIIFPWMVARGHRLPFLACFFFFLFFIINFPLVCLYGCVDTLVVARHTNILAVRLITPSPIPISGEKERKRTMGISIRVPKSYNHHVIFFVFIIFFNAQAVMRRVHVLG